MELDLYQIDTFTDKIFGGNPACVVPLEDWLSDDTLLNISRENAVPETAFFTAKDGVIHLRWFTPEIEMDLCGHATLAVAHCLQSIIGYPAKRMLFETKSGSLIVTEDNGIYTLDLPSRLPTLSSLPNVISMALNIQPIEVLKSRDYVLVYESEKDIENIEVNKQVFDQINLDPGGVVVTAMGDNCDFVSRYFTPQASILEDPVTGSAHCSLVPFWSSRFGKDELSAIQLSTRGGALKCINRGNRVMISGKAKTYSVGRLWTE